MIEDAKRNRALEQIKSNIENCGHHVYLISGGKIPRFVYTIGLSKCAGAELLFCGASLYSSKQAVELTNELARRLRSMKEAIVASVSLENFGSFSFRQADPSWSQHLLLGAFDYFNDTNIRALQIVPDAEHSTLDVPDASTKWNREADPVWQSLDGRWDLPFEADATAVTNLAALRGGRVTEAARWEANQWELFAGPGPDVQRHEMRVVPLSTMLGIDPSLLTVAKLDVGAALWRDSARGGWQEWRART